MKTHHPNENVEITVLPGTSGKAYSPADRDTIQRVIRDNLLLTSKEPYHKVQVEVQYQPDGSPAALVATMMRAHTYTADIVKVKLGPGYTVKSVEPLS